MLWQAPHIRFVPWRQCFRCPRSQASLPLQLFAFLRSSSIHRFVVFLRNRGDEPSATCTRDQFTRMVCTSKLAWPLLCRVSADTDIWRTEDGIMICEIDTLASRRYGTFLPSGVPQWRRKKTNRERKGSTDDAHNTEEK